MGVPEVPERYPRPKGELPQAPIVDSVRQLPASAR